MADSADSFPARSLLRAINASLRLANESADSLSVSQLSAMQHKLRETLGVIDGKIRARQKPTSENQKVVIDISDWDDSDTDSAANEQMETDEEEVGPLAIPKPYPTALPPGQEKADAYYVVDCGREV